MTTTTVLPTSDQQLALNAIMTWFSEQKKPYLTVGGYAGTGKTTLLAWLRKLLYREEPDLTVAFCAYTGKARQVLFQKLRDHKAITSQDSVSTIHGLMYEARTDAKGQVMSWNRRDDLSADLIIVDEASMVSRQIWDDLLSYHIPILAVGDHGQLPPIDSKFSLMEKPELRLEQIHRQAQASPIIQLSVLARTLGKIPVKRYGDGVIKYNRTDSSIGEINQSLLESWTKEVLFLVGMNWTRQKLNQQIRALRGYESEQPQAGDRVICLKNNRKTSVYNGMLGTVQRLEKTANDQGKYHWYQADIELEDGRIYSGKISAHQFNQDKTLTEVGGLRYDEIGDLFDFGYAITVHKAQGSQARKVVVYEQRSQHMDDEMWRRWLYTAVTRAEEELIIIGD